MKVAIFSLAYSPFVGGAEIAVKEITDRQSGQDFYCFTRRFDDVWPAREKLGNVEVIRLGKGRGDYYGHAWQKISYVFKAWRAAEKAHREKHFNAIWAIMAAYGGMAALLFKLRHPSIPLLLTLQEGDSEEHILKRVGVFYPLWKLLFKKADRIQAISHYLADFARRHGADCPIEIIPNGVDIQKFKTQNTKLKKQNTKIIITTSRLVHKNGMDTLIEAMKHVRQPAELWILGDGPQRQALELRAKGLPVKFFGSADPAEIPNYLNQADMFVRPSRSEGLGSSFLEAMAAGLPIIGTNVGGIPDFLKDGETGLFAEVDDPKDLASKINLLLSNPSLREKLALNGTRLILESYDWDLISGKMSNIFEALKGKKKILVATGIYPPDIGGPATYTVLLEQELPKRGFTVRVLPFGKVRNLPKIIRHLTYFFHALVALARNDLVYAQDPVSVGLPSMIAAKILGKPFLMRIAGDYAWEQAAQRFGVRDTIDVFQNKKYGFKTELLRRIQKFVSNQAKIIITPSQYFQKLVSEWVKNPEKVKVIYNGINLTYPHPAPRTPILKTILSAGRLVPWKGFDILIELMRELPDWKLIIVGDGPEHVELKLKIESLKLKEQIQLAGSVPREKLLELLRDATVFILNTSFESFSFQVVEAMNIGVPVITTNIGNLAEIIDHDRDGVLVEPNNRNQILAALRKIDGDPAFRETIIKNAHLKAQNFSIEKTVNQLSQLIWSLK